MREEYIQLRNQYNFLDTLDQIEELPYSKKLRILEVLLSKYSVRAIQMALHEYLINYVLANIVDLRVINTVIAAIAKRYDGQLKDRDKEIENIKEGF